MTAISSNHWSVDDQMVDAIRYLEREHPDFYRDFLAMFPEWERLQMDGSWVDTKAMGVDVEWSSWVIDWIEADTPIYWEDGEPWVVDRTACQHCNRAIEDDDGIWYHPDTMSARCDGPDDEEGIGWGDMVRQAEPIDS